MIKIGLPKGTSLHKSMELIKKITKIEVDSKKLCFYTDKIQIFLLKHRDIPVFIKNGVIDIGITLEEWIIEKESKLDIIKRLDWCDTRISLISNVGARVLVDEAKIKCITEFPNISEEFLRNQSKEFEICTISGSSEALVPCVFNCCIDCVETGGTLKQNGLQEEKIILYSKTVVAKRENTTLSKEIQDIINLIN